VLDEEEALVLGEVREGLGDVRRGGLRERPTERLRRLSPHEAPDGVNAGLDQVHLGHRHLLVVHQGKAGAMTVNVGRRR
jgi:hypothetical protein